VLSKPYQRYIDHRRTQTRRLRRYRRATVPLSEGTFPPEGAATGSLFELRSINSRRARLGAVLRRSLLARAG
jgi:hypothetical protein